MAHEVGVLRFLTGQQLTEHLPLVLAGNAVAALQAFDLPVGQYVFDLERVGADHEIRRYAEVAVHDEPNRLWYAVVIQAVEGGGFAFAILAALRVPIAAPRRLAQFARDDLAG